MAVKRLLLSSSLSRIALNFTNSVVTQIGLRVYPQLSVA